VRFEVLRALTVIKLVVFWLVCLCGVVDVVDNTVEELAASIVE